MNRVASQTILNAAIGLSTVPVAMGLLDPLPGNSVSESAIAAVGAGFLVFFTLTSQLVKKQQDTKTVDARIKAEVETAVAESSRELAAQNGQLKSELDSLIQRLTHRAKQAASQNN